MSAVPHPVADGPGRSCPLAYRYDPAVFRRSPDFAADTLYVVGGLYGNPFALDAVEALARRETQASPRGATAPRLIFNGDFHWFDIDPDVFGAINARVLRHVALRGNVETELAGEDDGFGCGCAYPPSVGDAEVERSNRIIGRLRDCARSMPAARRALGALPMHAVASVGAARVGIVHGDARSLAGWEFGVDALADARRDAARLDMLRAAGADIFASSHTCLPAMRRFDVDGRCCGIINNGAAGMSNFSGARSGVVSRIATTPAPVPAAVLHEAQWQVRGQTLYVAALALEYDDAAWRARFLADWPEGTPAHASYWKRIEQGPDYSAPRAYGE